MVKVRVSDKGVMSEKKTATEVMMENIPRFEYWCECPVCGERGVIEKSMSAIIMFLKCGCLCQPIMKHRRVS